MANQNLMPYTMTIQGLNDSLTVISFEGTEEIDELYRFEVLFACRNKALDLHALMLKQVVLTMAPLSGEGEPRYFCGICIEAETVEAADEIYRYKIAFAPTLWKATLDKAACVYQNVKLGQIIVKMLEKNGIFKFNIQKMIKDSYPTFEYLCQYNESDFNFMQRWGEELGVYHYFEHTQEGEIIYVADTQIAQNSIKGSPVRYSQQPNPLQSGTISKFHYKTVPVPGTFSYNNFDPNLKQMSSKASAQIMPDVDIVYHKFGGNPFVEQNFPHYATVEKERLLCRSALIKGEGNVASMMCGYTFSLSNHYAFDSDKSFMITKVYHKGDQSSFLNSNAADKPVYENSFEAIPSELQYRPQRIAETPKEYGLLYGTVEAPSSGTPYMDEYGRYKVKMPFDTQTIQGDKASCWIRMVQSSAASSSRGMQFGLMKGDTVAIAFAEGDIDRPVILGAVHSRDAVVSQANAYDDKIMTLAGHQVVFDNTPGQEAITLQHKNGSKMVFTNDGIKTLF